MEILPLHFKTLYYCGLWSEDMACCSYQSINTLFVVFLLFWYTLSHIIQFVLSPNDDEVAKNGLFISAPYIAIFLKILNYIVCSREITNLKKKFGAKICQPTSQQEGDILEKCNRENNVLFIRIMIFTLMCGSGILITPILNKQLKTFTLPLATYQPYPVSNWVLYSFTYIWQVVGSFYGILIHVSSDTMAYGFISLICAEYDIFYLRLMQIGRKNELFFMKTFIDHHVFIQELIHSTQAFFMGTVTVLFCCSLLTLSGSIFNAIQVSIVSVDFLSMIAYYMCMLLQCFLYCWFGNKLTEKSQGVADAIYNSNWDELDSVHRKGLQFIMLISTKGTVLTFHGQCLLNMNTFVWILKASYTALNLLKSGANV